MTSAEHSTCHNTTPTLNHSETIMLTTRGSTSASDDILDIVCYSTDYYAKGFLWYDICTFAHTKTFHIIAHTRTCPGTHAHIIK